MPTQSRIDPSRLDPEGLYARLGVSPSAEPDEIRAAFRQKARILHPDVPGTGDANAFVAARQAYDTLHNLHHRAAYDRVARQAARVGAMKIAPSDTQAPPLRHPRLSDLPIGVWVGAAVVVCLGLGQAVLHLSAGHAPRHDAAPVSTTAASSAPVPEPKPPVEPIRLVDAPNYYTVPGAGPTILWRREPNRPDLVPGPHLPPFSTVQGERLQNGMVEVRVSDTETGLVEATRLAPGDANAARRAYCAYNAGPAPADGEILTRRAAGSNALEVSNRAAQPLVLKLRDTLGDLAVAVFLGPGTQTTVIGLPRGQYLPEFAIGELWSRACNSFAAGMRAQQFTTPLPLPALSPLSLPAEPDKLRDIPDHQFEAD